MVVPALTTSAAPGATVTLSVSVWVPVQVSCPLSNPSVVWLIPAADTGGIEIIEIITDSIINAINDTLFFFKFEDTITPL